MVWTYTIYLDNQKHSDEHVYVVLLKNSCSAWTLPFKSLPRQCILWKGTHASSSLIAVFMLHHQLLPNYSSHATSMRITHIKHGQCSCPASTLTSHLFLECFALLTLVVRKHNLKNNYNWETLQLSNPQRKTWLYLLKKGGGGAGMV